MRTWLALVALLAAACSSRDEAALPEPSQTPSPTPNPNPTPSPEPEPDVTLEPAPRSDAAPEAPPLPGTHRLVGEEVRYFGVNDASIYWCAWGAMRAAPKAGGEARHVGPCESGFAVLDGDTLYDCGQRGLVRRSGGAETVLATSPCVGPLLDEEHVYYVVPGFDQIPDPGVYRVARSGGAPEKLLAGTAREQFILALDADALWIGTFGAGTIYRLPMGGRLTKVVTGQRRLVDLALDDRHLYWLIEDAREVRRRSKKGGAVEVIGRNVVQEPLAVLTGHAYWFEGDEMQPQRLVHLAPGATEPVTVIDGLLAPWVQVDDTTLYLSVSDRPGVFAVSR